MGYLIHYWKLDETLEALSLQGCFEGCLAGLETSVERQALDHKGRVIAGA